MIIHTFAKRLTWPYSFCNSVCKRDSDLSLHDYVQFSPNFSAFVYEIAFHGSEWLEQTTQSDDCGLLERAEERYTLDYVVVPKVGARVQRMCFRAKERCLTRSLIT